MFDFEKLLWFNSEYLRMLSDEDFFGMADRFIKSDIPVGINTNKMLALLKTRIAKLTELDEKMAFFLALPEYDKELFLNKKNKINELDTVKTVLLAAKEVLCGVESFDNDTLFAALSPLTEKLGLKTGAIMWCIRIAVSGLSATPGGATEIMEVVGKAETLARIETALNKLA